MLCDPWNLLFPESGRYALTSGSGNPLQSIVSGSPGKNGYVESFNGKLRDELLNGEIF